MNTTVKQPAPLEDRSDEREKATFAEQVRKRLNQSARDVTFLRTADPDKAAIWHTLWEHAMPKGSLWDVQGTVLACANSAWAFFDGGGAMRRVVFTCDAFGTITMVGVVDTIGVDKGSFFLGSMLATFDFVGQVVRLRVQQITGGVVVNWVGRTIVQEIRDPIVWGSSLDGSPGLAPDVGGGVILA